MESTDEEIEYEAHDCPRCVVDSRRRWHSGKASEADRDVDVSPERQGKTPSQKVEGDGSECTDREEPEEARITWVNI